MIKRQARKLKRIRAEVLAQQENHKKLGITLAKLQLAIMKRQQNGNEKR